MSMTITHSGGTTVVDSYTLRPTERRYAVSAPFPAYSRTPASLRGDRLQVPAPVVVEAEFGGGFAVALAEARSVVSDAEDATSLEVHEGTWTVDGLLEHEITALPGGVKLRLVFAPTGVMS